MPSTEGHDHAPSTVPPVDWQPVCPRGFPQTPQACLGYYERGPGRLQLRFLAGGDQAACDVVVREETDLVLVRLILCRGSELVPYTAEDRTHVYLEEPLGTRTVIDFETGEPMPFYVPTYWNDRRLTAPGFYTDADQARAAWEPLPAGPEPEGWGRSRWPLRTLGF